MERIWHKKRIWTLAIILLFAILLSSGCGGRQIGNGNMGETTEISTEEETVENTTNISTGQEDTVKDTSALKLLLNDEEINVRWEDNEAVQALYELAAKESVTISMSMYGGFEQVGSIGANLPANDEQMTTVPGDIVLYSGNQIVVFYGSNTWPYTKLGHITEKSEQELAELLNNGNVTIRIEAAMESATDNSKVNSFDFENKTVLLNSGYEMPIMGLGTYSLDYDTCVNSVKALLQNGGRLIDGLGLIRTKLETTRSSIAFSIIAMNLDQIAAFFYAVFGIDFQCAVEESYVQFCWGNFVSVPEF